MYPHLTHVFLILALHEQVENMRVDQQRGGRTSEAADQPLMANMEGANLPTQTSAEESPEVWSGVNPVYHVRSGQRDWEGQGFVSVGPALQRGTLRIGALRGDYRG